MQKLIEKQLEKEKKDKQISFATTLALFVLILFFSMFWIAFQGTIPPIDEPQWKTIAYIDAPRGEGKSGRKTQPIPKPAAKSQSKAIPKTEVQETVKPKAVPPPVKTTVSTTESENVVKETKTPPKPKETTTNTDDSSPTEVKETHQPTKETASDNSTDTDTNDADSNSSTDDNASSNADTDGKGSGLGVKDEGLFKFGQGIGGPGGRKPLSIKLPGYNIQQEAKITFRFVIAPSGEVIYVKPEWTTHSDLAKIGGDAIKRWRFSEVEDSRGNLTTSVTITFRLN